MITYWYIDNPICRRNWRLTFDHIQAERKFPDIPRRLKSSQRNFRVKKISHTALKKINEKNFLSYLSMPTKVNYQMFQCFNLCTFSSFPRPMMLLKMRLFSWIFHKIGQILKRCNSLCLVVRLCLGRGRNLSCKFGPEAEARRPYYNESAVSAIV